MLVPFNISVKIALDETSISLGFILVLYFARTSTIYVYSFSVILNLRFSAILSKAGRYNLDQFNGSG